MITYALFVQYVQNCPAYKRDLLSLRLMIKCHLMKRIHQVTRFDYYFKNFEKMVLMSLKTKT